MTVAFAASVLVKATIVAALALAAARAARSSRAAVRHLLLAAGFAVLLILPIAASVAPAIRVRVPVRASTATASAALEVIVDATADGAHERGGLPSATAAGRASWSSMPVALGGIWITGAALFLLPVIVGFRQLRALRRTARPWRQAQTIADVLARETGIGRRIAVMLHESVPGPMTCGIRYPVIVLPIDARAWTDEDLRRAIVHELEHVRRFDWLTHCAARVVCAGYWFHPLVWAGWRQLALEAERACDDAVVRRADATAYADQLVELARRLSAATEQPQLAMAGRHDLSARVFAVLDSRQRRGRAGAQWIAFACAVSALIAATIAPLRVVAAQDPGAKAGPPQRFDAASIRPCRAEEAPPGPARGGMGGTNATFSPGRMNVPCATLEQLIYLAYAGSGAWPDNQLVNVVPGGASDSSKVRGGPAWVHSQHDKFAVEATAAGASERNVLVGAMLRTLLEDRFHLQIHRETEDLPMYALKVAPGGLRLKPMKAGDCEEYQPGDRPDPNAAKPSCDSLTMGGNGPNTVWRFGGFKLQSLAARLSGALGRYVIDQTGVTDEFIIRLEFHPDESTPGIRMPPEREADTSAPQAASIFTALEQQIGVRLEKTRGPRGYLVIDHVEPLTPNGGQ